MMVKLVLSAAALAASSLLIRDITLHSFSYISMRYPLPIIQPLNRGAAPDIKNGITFVMP